MKTFPQHVRHVVAGLRRRFRRAGFGAMARVTQELGLRRSYFSEKSSRPPQIFDVGVLLAALESLGADVAVFFRELYPAAAGSEELWEGPEPVEDRAPPAIRRAVRLAGERMRTELGLAVHVGDLEGGEATGGGSAGTSADPGPRLGAEWLEALDPHNRPEEAVVNLAAHIHEVEPAHLPRALALWSSALRILFELEAAAFLNLRALRLARAAGDDAAVADLLQRRAHIMADAGDHGRALALAEQAGGIFDRLGDRAGRGRAAVDQGMFLHYLERSREAIVVTERARKLLPESLPRNHFAALVGIGLCHMKLQDFQKALDAVEAASRLPVGRWDQGKLEWLKGSICYKLGIQGEAEQHLRQGVEIIQEFHHGEASLVSLELVQLLLEQGNISEAGQITSSMMCQLVTPFEKSPILSGALAELLRLAASGRGLSLSVVRRVHAIIERESKRPDAKARRAWRALAVAGPSR
jgi:tetratricopeptide (TPR) repeat protein